MRPVGRPDTACSSAQRRLRNSIPPGFKQPNPEGMVESSPALQRWGCGQWAPSPEGTADTNVFNRPFRTDLCDGLNPALKRRAILVCPSGTRAEPQPYHAIASASPGSAGFQACRIADFPVGKPHGFQTLTASSGARGFGNPRYGRFGNLRYGLNSGAPG